MRLALLALAAAATTIGSAQTPFGPNPPRLTVVISIDQFRNDYTMRFAPFFMPARSGSGVGGFAYVMQTGAVSVSYTHLDVYKRQVRPVGMPVAPRPPRAPLTLR